MSKSFGGWHEEHKEYLKDLSPIEALRFAFNSGYVEGSKMERDRQSAYHVQAYERRKAELAEREIAHGVVGPNT